MKRLIASIEEHVAFYGPNGKRSLSIRPPLYRHSTHGCQNRLRRRVIVARYASDRDYKVKVLACLGWNEITRVL